MNKLGSFAWNALCVVCPKLAVRIQYHHILGERINLRFPKDINEKINYLKFHSNMKEWARMADKYTVREYVLERGLGEILVPLYGKYDTTQELIDNWNRLPNQFVLKANHGCGEIKLVKDKTSIDIHQMKLCTDAWLKEKFGRETNERHYLRIKPCLLVEQLLEDESVYQFSRSLVDYKVWCFNGNPFCILVALDRDVENVGGEHHVFLDVYDTKWNRIIGAMSDKAQLPDRELPKPKNLDKLLECAAILAKGWRQIRVDLYSIEERVYFGEMTLTSQSGYMNYFTKDFLLKMGSQFEVK